MALATKRNLLHLLAAAIFALILGGCASSINVQSDPNASVIVSGQADSARMLAASESNLGDEAQAVNDDPDQLPFMRSEPKAVAPFPLVLNRIVQHYVNQYVAQPEGLKQSFRRSEPYMSDMIRELKQAGLPSDLIYLAFAESGFSPEGDGPWQLEKATARRFGLVVNRWVDERRDPIKSTRAAAEYLATLHDSAGSWRMTLVAWNNGDTWLDRCAQLRNVSYERLMKKLPRHTRSLMNRFMAVALIARHADAYGLEQVNFHQPRHYRVLKVKGGTLLSRIAAMTHVAVEALKEANPALLRDRIPPTLASYNIRVPDDQLQAQMAEF